MKLKLDDLPESLREMVDLIGLSATLQLVKQFGGLIALYVPHEIGADHQLAAALGLPAARKLAAHYGGDCLRNIPRCTHRLRGLRNAEIRARRKAGESPATLACAYGMTERNVWMILAE